MTVRRSFRSLLAVAALSSALFVTPAAAATGLDVQAWLSRPGVKLVVVEFYATWCKPCMEAVPRWKALHDKYREQGLRLIVVATQDPQAGCVNPGWNPDEVVCDDEGFVARAFGADQRLPAAFLWSWQGNLLARNGHVDEVEKEVQAWIRRSPRVAISVEEVAKRTGTSKRELTDLLRREISRGDKLVVVASAAERRRLDKIRKASFSGRYDQNLQCEVGKDLSANSLLETRLVGRGKRKRLALNLLSAERGCLVASSVVDWNRRRPAVSVAEGVAELMQGLRKRPETPRGRAVSSRRIAPRPSITPPVDDGWEPQAVQRAIVEFSSTPPGAVVMVDGKLLCQSTARRCARELTVGTHSVSMQAERYRARIEQVQVTESTKLSWKLEPDFGTVSVQPEPSGLPIKLRIDGVERKLPVKGLELSAGSHSLQVEGPCVNPTRQNFELARGETKALPVSLRVRYAGLDVSSVDGEGNAMPGQIFVDGEAKGYTPAVLKVSACAKKAEVRHAELGTWSTALSLTPRTTTPIRAVFETQRFPSSSLPGPAVPGTGKPRARGTKFTVGSRVKVTNKGSVYSTINRTKCLTWPNANVKKRGGKDGWGSWKPKNGDVGEIVAFVRHCSQKRDLAIVRFGSRYAAFGEKGLSRASGASDQASKPSASSWSPDPGSGSIYARHRNHVSGKGKVLRRGKTFSVGDRVKVVKKGSLYSTINRTKCLTWPSAEIKKKAGKDAWGKWYPKDGMRGRIVGFVEHCSGNKPVALVYLDGRYAVFGEHGLKRN